MGRKVIETALGVGCDYCGGQLGKAILTDTGARVCSERCKRLHRKRQAVLPKTQRPKAEEDR